MTCHPQNLLVRRVDDAIVVVLARPDLIDTEYLKDLETELMSLVSTSVEPVHLVIDFEPVRYLCSAALGMFVGIRNEVARRNGDLRISNVAREVYKVFEITRINKLVRICGTTEDAVRSFA